MIENEVIEEQFGRFYLHASSFWDSDLPTENNKNNDGLKGKYILKDVEYVEIITKGTGNTCSVIATEEHRERWPSSYAEFKGLHGDVGDGTRIERLSFFGPSQIHSLKSVGIMTVEDLANLGEQACNKMQGARTMKKQAQAYLDAVNVESVDDTELIDNEPDDEPRVDKPRRGRPPKNVNQSVSA